MKSPLFRLTVKNASGVYVIFMENLPNLKKQVTSVHAQNKDNKQLYKTIPNLTSLLHVFLHKFYKTVSPSL